MKKFSFLETTIDAVQQAMLEKELTSVELVDWYLKQIEEYDREIQAIVNINPKARETAKNLDEYMNINNELIGPLHGVPILIKDQGETVEIPTTFGSIGFKDYIPEQDATVVKKLKEAGAIVLAKTNLCEFGGGWFSFSTINGHTKNPYDFERDAGGSSAGTGAGIASNFGLIGIGEDTGGSIRIPSSFNNLFGIRVTKGLISANGFGALLRHQDTPGPMTRTVRDLSKVLDVITGYDSQDIYTSATVNSTELGNYENSLNNASLKNVRIGILREAFGSNEDKRMKPVNELIEKTISNLENAGAVLVDPIEIPKLQSYLDNTSLYENQSKRDMTDFLSKRPNAPLKSFMDIYNEKAYHPLNDLFHDIANGPNDPTTTIEYYEKHMRQIDFQKEILNVFAKNNFDAILFPNVQILPPTREYLENEEWSSLTFETNTTIASQAILPAISVPSGFSNNGIPVGFELLGKPYSEGKLIQYAYVYEQLYNPRKKPEFNNKNGV